MLALPLTEFPEWPGARQRLGRWFNAPRFDPRGETLWLQLAAVTGLRSIRINDHEIAAAPFAGDPLLVPLAEDLRDRNHLVLDVDLTAGNRPASGFSWAKLRS